MRKYNIVSILGCVGLLLSSSVQADISNPSGIWDISGKPKLSISLSGKLYKVPFKTPLSAAVQFQDGNSYAFLAQPPAAWPTTHGQWQFNPGPKTYRVSYDPSAFDLTNVVSGQSLTPFLVTYLNNFEAVAKKKFNVTAGIPISSLQVKSYIDQGKLTPKGALKGTQHIQIILTYQNPKTQRSATAKVKSIMAYTGIQASAATQAGAVSTCCSGQDAQKNLLDSQAFLDANKTLLGVQTTASGLQYVVINPGSGNPPQATDKVTIAYRGTFPNGQVFDKGNANASFALDGVVPGFKEGLELMPLGAYYRFYMPPELAYGAAGVARVIPPNTALVFDVVLRKIN